MIGLRSCRALLRREVSALRAQKAFLAGWSATALGGMAVASLSGSSESAIWILYQVVYYFIPLAGVLAAIVVVRQDLRESSLLAQIPGASLPRVIAKGIAAFAYALVGMFLLIAPSLPARLEAGPALLLFLAGAALAAVSVSFGVFLGLRARHEVRAYFGGLILWLLGLLGSGFAAHAAHVFLAPEQTAVVTLLTLMANPIESFRIFVFFGLSAVPMNPHSANPVAQWWLANPLLWLLLVSLFHAVWPVMIAGRKLRYRSWT